MSSAGARLPIGLLGGAFDPVHNGHLRLAIEAREALSLDHVRLIPVATPNHRDAPVAAAAQRVAMLRAAVTAAGVEIDTCEIERGAVSYTVDTLAALRRRLDGRPLVLILGLDAFNGLPAWHRWAELLSLCHIAVASRPGADPAGHPALVELIGRAGVRDPARLLTMPAGLIYFLHIPLLPISSSDIRRRVQQGRSVAYLVPDPVLRIIDRERLYLA